MIEVKRLNGGRLFVPLDLVKSITEDDAGKLKLTYQRHNGETAWVEIETFQLLPVGTEIS